MAQKEEVLIYDEIGVILEFLNEVGPRSKELIKEFKKMQESVQKVDKLEDQIKIWDMALKKFVFFDEDADVAGERVKLISKTLKKRAEKEKVPVVVQKLMEKDAWEFDW